MNANEAKSLRRGAAVQIAAALAGSGDKETITFTAVEIATELVAQLSLREEVEEKTAADKARNGQREADSKKAAERDAAAIPPVTPLEPH